ncbi:aminotransferase class I/II-fold pyridoxal phosphate-dependent enzyme [Desmospora activa]|uniref:Histidinol-phosphate aminotransferase n=1 Tax=Desmospora activa DSM 45169 TaxID=1121389 RepID=A0A2T4Z0Q3_9BACL|nr:aminotransferase class I/II-fold pyridoxal phosphate-dependent enzyme [Desmospora activa]PTM53259.1 histidinol-phosphate aminotransferase [Desmospora activa DSM 45169]
MEDTRLSTSAKAEKRAPFSNLVNALPATVPFVPPEQTERQLGRRFQLRLGANESSFGLSPMAKQALIDAAAETNWYGDATNDALRQKLSRLHGVPMESIAVGAGIDEILGWIARLFLNPGDGVTTSHGSYPTFHYHVNGFGGVLHWVPYRHFYNDCEGLARQAHATGSRIVYLANPDNPTGTFLKQEDIRELRRQLPADCVLVIDEAYVEFAPAEDVLPLDANDPNVIRTRTFSKVYGLAGARVGYAIAHPDTIASFDKIRNHFGVARAAQQAALASLADSDFLNRVIAFVNEGKTDYSTLAQELGYTTLPSATNFVAIDTGSEKAARWWMDALEKQGVFIRVPGVAPLNRCLRITVGNQEERNILAHHMKKLKPQVPINEETR